MTKNVVVYETEDTIVFGVLYRSIAQGYVIYNKDTKTYSAWYKEECVGRNHPTLTLAAVDVMRATF
jgi:hypothetical protein